MPFSNTGPRTSTAIDGHRGATTLDIVKVPRIAWRQPMLHHEASRLAKNDNISSRAAMVG